MASLKRYRQTTDSNAAARFRDLPPRFKRQKSIPSPESSTVDNHKPHQNNKSKKSSQKDSVVLIGNNSATQSRSEVIQPIELYSKDKKGLKKSNGNRPRLTVDQNYSRRLTQPIVLSPMDNKLFDLTRNDEQDHYPTLVSDNGNPFSWQNQHQSTWPNYSPYGQAGPAEANTSWISDSNPHETIDSHHNGNSQATTLPTANLPLPYDESQPKDYSETDKRIIEMFKELERVADQKEKEEEDENGSDRKSLVSHHLRMLMCAIDKYTEGIDDEEDSEGSVDEAPMQDKRSSPLATQTTVTAETCTTSKGAPDSQQPARFSGSSGYVIPSSEVQTFPSIYTQNLQINHPLNPCTAIYQQVPYITDSFTTLNGGKSFEMPTKFKPSFASIETQPWDLWSSPSFNGLDVFSNWSKGHNSSETADSAFALFDRLGMENDYNPRTEECWTRTPLYKR